MGFDTETKICSSTGTFANIRDTYLEEGYCKKLAPLFVAGTSAECPYVDNLPISSQPQGGRMPWPSQGYSRVPDTHPEAHHIHPSQKDIQSTWPMGTRAMASASRAECTKWPAEPKSQREYKREPKGKHEDISPTPTILRDKKAGEISDLFAETVAGRSFSILLNCLIIARDKKLDTEEDLAKNIKKSHWDNTLMSGWFPTTFVEYSSAIVGHLQGQRWPMISISSQLFHCFSLPVFHPSFYGSNTTNVNQYEPTRF